MRTKSTEEHSREWLEGYNAFRYPPEHMPYDQTQYRELCDFLEGLDYAMGEHLAAMAHGRGNTFFTVH